MRFLFVFAVLLAIVWASPAGKKEPTKLECSKTCSADYAPVCGVPQIGKGNTVTFGNTCVMENYNCEAKKNYVVKQQGECGDKSPVRLS